VLTPTRIPRLRPRCLRRRGPACASGDPISAAGWRWSMPSRGLTLRPRCALVPCTLSTACTPPLPCQPSVTVLCPVSMDAGGRDGVCDEGRWAVDGAGRLKSGECDRVRRAWVHSAPVAPHAQPRYQDLGRHENRSMLGTRIHGGRQQHSNTATT
jgi:hypothetical protein